MVSRYVGIDSEGEGGSRRTVKNQHTSHFYQDVFFQDG